MEYGNKISDRLRWLRNLHGIKSKAALAAAADIKYGAYQRWEYGGHPNRKNINKLAQFYGCSRAWLETGEGVPYPDHPQERPESYSAEPSSPLVIKEFSIQYDKEGIEKINIDEAIGKTYKILRSGTPYAVALYLNISLFSSALDTGAALKICQDEIKELKTQVNKLQEQVDRLAAASGDSSE